MSREAKQFHCPNCNADLKFSPGKQKFTCDYCRSEFTEEEIKEFQQNQEVYENEQDPDDIPQQDEMTQEDIDRQTQFEEENKLYSCPSCGAEIVSDANTAASFCYYCHNPVILKGRVEGKYAPAKVLPFSLDREKAVDTFKSWARSKLFIPKDLISNSQIEKMTGLYVPFWVANSSTTTHVEATGTNYRHWTSGNYRYTERSTYKIIRDISVNYTGVPGDGSQKIEDALMEAIEPFDYKQARPFEMAYLSGFMADKYDVEKEKMFPRIRQRMFENNRDIVNSTIHYQNVSGKRENSTVNTLSWQYMLLPVWFMTFNYKGKTWEYAINGQSGKIAGELPISMPKLIFGSVLSAVLTAVAAFFIGGFFLG